MNADLHETLTLGVDHIGLTVGDLSASVRFFVEGLGWVEKGGKPDYPASFVSDGHLTVTLWQAAGPGEPVPFNRRTNIGLHHLAFRVASSEALDAVYARVAQWPGVVVEFEPEFSGKGPKRHFMLQEPGGNRVEFAWDPRPR